MFDNIRQLLWDSPLGAPPRVEAALYRALAQLPGIQVIQKTKDGAGDRAIALVYGDTQLLLDPATYRFIGWQTVSNGVQPKRP